MDPFLKWAGGKRWLRSKLADANFEYSGRYIEPFLGSGAVFFALEPKTALLSDLNSKLIETYCAIRSSPSLVRRYLREFSRNHSTEFYYEIRGKIFRSQARRAAQFIYLNRTCWNGLYRVNKKGQFNVPRGTKSAVMLPSDDFQATSRILLKSEIYCADFETIIDRSEEGDFIYCDPPYTVHHNFNGFLKYNETIFSWDDQRRLRASLDRAVARGSRVLVSNANHDSIMGLYQGFGEIEELNRSSVISGKNHGRGSYAELLIHG